MRTNAPQISANSIKAFVLGEHSDSQFQMSLSPLPQNVGSCVSRLSPLQTLDPAPIAEQCWNTAATITNGKGATSSGISCCLSLPVVLGRQGAARALPQKLNDEEHEALEKSAEMLRDVIAQARKDFKLGGA
ncbi:hypothetical protein VUR80DRAFT_712 [Thermomyces stellatus]